MHKLRGDGMQLRNLARLAGLIAAALIARPVYGQSFIEGNHYWFEPAVFPGKSDLSRHPYGPAKAKGLVIWNHGYDPGKLAPEKVPPIMQYFAEAGWDAYHLQRHSIIGVGRGRSVAGSSNDLTAPLILHVLEKAEVNAYSRIVLMGQSRGGFAVIQAGAYKPRITAILPLSPAGFGDAGKTSEWRQNDTFIRNLWEDYKDSGIRVAAGFFTGDPWYEEQHSHVRGPYARQRLTELGVPNFIIDQPEHPKMQGHGGGQSWEFARRFGPCIEHFFETGNSPSCAEADRNTARIFGIKLPQLPAPNGYTGLWQGTWHNGRFIALMIQPPANGQYRAVYRQGLGTNGDTPQSSDWTLSEHDGGLLQQGNTIDFHLKLVAPDRLSIIRIDRNKRSEKNEQPVYFTRARERSLP